MNPQIPTTPEAQPATPNGNGVLLGTTDLGNQIASESERTQYAQGNSPSDYGRSPVGRNANVEWVETTDTDTDTPIVANSPAQVSLFEAAEQAATNSVGLAEARAILSKDTKPDVKPATNVPTGSPSKEFVASRIRILGQGPFTGPVRALAPRLPGRPRR